MKPSDLSKLFKKENFIGIAVLTAILLFTTKSCGKKEEDKAKASGSERMAVPTTSESSAPAEKPEPSIPSVPTVPVTPVITHTPPSVQELILALGDQNGAVAREAAVQLVAQANVSELTDAFALGNPKMKERVLWCLRQTNEPMRIFFSKVRSNPLDYHPRIRVAIEEITTALSGGFYQTTSEVIPVDSPTEKKIFLLQLENQLKDRRKELQELRTRMLQAARNAHTTWVSPYFYWTQQSRSMEIRQKYATRCILLKSKIAETEEIISLLSGEINDLRKEIETLSM